MTHTGFNTRPARSMMRHAAETAAAKMMATWIPKVGSAATSAPAPSVPRATNAARRGDATDALNARKVIEQRQALLLLES